MKNLIKMYQNSGNREVIERILSYADEDLMQYRYNTPDEAVKASDGLVYVAYRVRGILLDDCFRERNFRFKWQSSKQEKDDYKALFNQKMSDYIFDDNKKINQKNWGLKDDYIVINEADTDSSWLDDLAKNEWLGVDVDEVESFNFRSIYKNFDKIMEYYGEKAGELFYLCKKFEKLSMDSQEFEDDFNETKEKLLASLVNALEYALSKVDTNRDDKEIVKYINLALSTRYTQLKLEQSDTKMVRKNGENHYIQPKFEDAENAVWMMITGKSFKFVGADAFDNYLTKSQKALLMTVYDIVRDEYIKENVDFFHWDIKGKAYLNKRNVADKLNINEANFKQKLKRIIDRVHSNWSVVWQDKRKVM